MSYSFSAQIPDGATGDEIRSALHEAFVNGNPTAAEAPECQAHVSELGEAAVKLIGVMGRGPHTVTVSGHANPDHEPREGWSNDTASVYVSQNAEIATQPDEPADPDPEPEEPAPSSTEPEPEPAAPAAEEHAELGGEG